MKLSLKNIKAMQWSQNPEIRGQIYNKIKSKIVYKIICEIEEKVWWEVRNQLLEILIEIKQISTNEIIFKKH